MGGKNNAPPKEAYTCNYDATGLTRCRPFITIPMCEACEIFYFRQENGLPNHREPKLWL